MKEATVAVVEKKTDAVERFVEGHTLQPTRNGTRSLTSDIQRRQDDMTITDGAFSGHDARPSSNN